MKAYKWTIRFVALDNKEERRADRREATASLAKLWSKAKVAAKKAAAKK